MTQRDEALEANRRAPDVHLNLNVRGMAPSATIAINERSAELKAAGRTVFRLGLGQSPFPVPESVVQALKDNAHQKDYLPVKGLPALRQAVADYHRRVQGIDARPEGVLIGPGSKELMFLLQLVYYGDIVIPTPAWVSYAPQAAIIGRQVYWLRTRRDRGYKLLPEQLETLCELDPDRPRILVLNYPSNPTGISYTPSELEELARVAQRYRVVVLSDEIYGELQFDSKHASIANYYPEGTIVSSGLSKWCGAGGWRLGTFTFPPALAWLCDTMAAVASETYTSTSAPIQYAAITAFRGSPEIESYLERSRAVLAAIASHCHRRLTEAEIDVPEPAGGFYLFCNFDRFRSSLSARGVNTSAGLCSALLDDTGVAILAGGSFGRRDRELTTRLAIVDFDGGAALAAAEGATAPLGDDFAKAYAPNVVEAVERLIGWVHADGGATEAAR